MAIREGVLAFATYNPSGEVVAKMRYRQDTTGSGFEKLAQTKTRLQNQMLATRVQDVAVRSMNFFVSASVPHKSRICSS